MTSSALLEEGRAVVQETRRWDDNKESSHAMRSKEDAKDYRYFPDPDLPPIDISDAWIASIRAAQPELKKAKSRRYQSEYGLSAYDADILNISCRIHIRLKHDSKHILCSLVVDDALLKECDKRCQMLCCEGDPRCL